MDFEDTAEEAAFRLEVRTWLDTNAQRKSHPNETWASTLTDKSQSNIVRLAREFQLKKYEDGWACLHWPKAYGAEHTPAMAFVRPPGITRSGIGRWGSVCSTASPWRPRRHARRVWPAWR